MHFFRCLFKTLIRPVKNRSVRLNLISLLAGGIFGVSSIIYYQNSRTYNTYFNSLIPRLNVPHKIDKNNFIVNVSDKCSPSVVTVEVRSNQRYLPTGNPALLSTGSGFAAKSDGWIITNAHVIMNKPNSNILVVTKNGDKHEAVVTDIDLKLDLALLKINSNQIPALKLGESRDVIPGEWVVAIGSPLSMKHTVSAGVISSIDRSSKELGMLNLDMKYIQTDAAITFGHSGGPLVNLNGEVIGVNNLRITAGIAFAIPINNVKEFLNKSELLSKKNEAVQNSMRHAFFGVTTLPVTSDVIDSLQANHAIIIPEDMKGVLIWNVILDSPAFKAGLQTGDLITHINHESVQNVAELYIMLERSTSKQILFTLLRNGIIKTFTYSQ